jgi:hypothetical protein
MIEIKLGDLAQILNGELIGDPGQLVTGSVETDSRLVGEGSLFFAKPGEETDGHKFVGSALEKGAVAAVVEHQVSERINQIVVSDSVEALGLLAAWLIRELKATGKPPALIEGKDPMEHWYLKVTAEPGTSIEEWVSLVTDMTLMGLEQVGSEADIMKLFTLNRVIFDRLKAEDEVSHKALMLDFKNAKEKLKG